MKKNKQEQLSPEQKKETLPDQDNSEKNEKRQGLDTATIVKFIGLLAFIALIALACVLAWPIISELFEEGGIDLVVESVQSIGFGGSLIILGLQFIQIVVAFIPGEIVQFAAGVVYGPWLGALILIVGCVISSAFIFFMVHRLGAPFVQSMVPTKHLEKFEKLEETGKLNIIVFVLFLIPGLPKDVFTYLVPLTNMRMRDFLVLSNIGRIPGILVTTYMADGFIEGRIWQSVIIFVIAAGIAILGLIYREKLLGLVERFHEKIDDKKSRKKGTDKLD